VVVGSNVSGRTPYVIEAIPQALRHSAPSVFVAWNPDLGAAPEADTAIDVVGPSPSPGRPGWTPAPRRSSS